MARIEYSTDAGDTNEFHTVLGNSDFSTIGRATQYHVWNSGAEAIKLSVAGQNDLVLEMSVTNAEVSKHSGSVLTVPVNGNNLVIDAGGSIHMTVTVLEIDGTPANNLGTFSASGVHTEVGLDGNEIYIARLIGGLAGFNSAL